MEPKIKSACEREILETVKVGNLVYSLQKGKFSHVIMIHWFGKVRNGSPKPTHNMDLECKGDWAFVEKRWEQVKRRVA